MQTKPSIASFLHQYGFRFAVSAVAVFGLVVPVCPVSAQRVLIDTSATPVEVVMVRHAPIIAGNVAGTIRQLLPEQLTVAGSSVISGDVMLPGMPRVRMTGSAVYAGTIDEGGSALPNDYIVALGGQARVGHVVRCVDPKSMPTVDAALPPSGTESMVLSSPEQCIRHWETVRDLALTGEALPCTVPPGSYGDFRADAGTAFVLGIAGSSSPTQYSFESLSMSGQTSLQIVGPVVVIVTRGFILGGSAGNAANPGWLKLQIRQNDLILNSGSTLNAIVTAPHSSAYVNATAMLNGYLAADRLWVGAGGVIGPATEPQGPTEIFGYQSAWRYKVFASSDDVPEGWEEGDFNARGFTNGRGAFASAGVCDLEGQRVTDWPVNSEIIIRRNFRLPATVTSLRISGTVAGDVEIFLNGRLITDWVTHEGCPQLDDLSFTAPVNSYWVGLNTIAIRARATDEMSFVDYRVSINE